MKNLQYKTIEKVFVKYNESNLAVGLTSIH